MNKLGWAAVLVAAAHMTLAQPPMRQQTPASQAKLRGDAAHGEAIVEGKGGCLACHRVADRGSHLGPDLSAVGNSRSVAQLQKALLDPSPEVSASYQTYKVTTKAGKSYSGRLMNQDRTSIQLLD